MQDTTREETRRALVDVLAAIEAAPVGWRPPGTLTGERLEAGRAWLEDLRRAVGRAVARLEDPARVRTYVFATAARLRSRREDLDRDVSRTAAAAPPGESDGAPWMHYGERRIARALRAVPFAVNGVEAAAREALDALDRVESSGAKREETGTEAPETSPAPPGPIRLHVAEADLETTHGEPPRERARVRVRVEAPGRPLADREASYRQWLEVEAATKRGADFASDDTGKRASRLVDLLREWGLAPERDGERVRLRGVRVVRVDDWDPARTIRRLAEEATRREAGGRSRR